MKSYDTNAEDVPTTKSVGATEVNEKCTDPDGGSWCSSIVLNGFEKTCTDRTDASGTYCQYSKSVAHHNFDLAIEESYSYDLWDQDKTMGCKCDPVYYGADCSLMKCKYGVDPLFYDDVDGRIYQTSVVHLGNKDRSGNLGGTFRIVFFDVFGEKYTTKPIDVNVDTVSALKIQTALEALPNGVISKLHGDVTFEPGAGDVKANAKSPAVDVSMQKERGTITMAGTIGAGSVGGDPGVNSHFDGGAGFGTLGGGIGTDDAIGYGPEFTVTFSTNPGVLKTIELDTRQITNPGRTDYWVANARQGQFSSRYPINLGRVNTLRYGSKLLYTNNDLTTTVPVDTLVKVGGQETRVTAVEEHMVTLADPFLGSSILPIIIDTGITGTALNYLGISTTVGQLAMTSGKVGKVTDLTLPDIVSGAKLYINGCPLVSKGTRADGTGLADDSPDLKVKFGNDCNTDLFSPSTLQLFRRSDDTSNQNFYKTSGDLAAGATQTFCPRRGSKHMYTCEPYERDIVTSFAASGGSTGRLFKTGLRDMEEIQVGESVFVNGLGPMPVTELTTSDSFTATDAEGFFVDAGGGDDTLTQWLVHKVVENTEIRAGSIVLLDGRRYKVAYTEAQDGVANAKITFTETYAGGQLLQLCSNCVTEVAEGKITTDLNMNLKHSDKLMVYGQTHQQLLVSVQAGIGQLTTIPISPGGWNGFPTHLTAQNGGSTGTKLTGTNRLHLYKALNTHAMTPTLVTEARAAVTYQYVTQCSSRGTCESMLGLCVCFTGYAGDNCDTQNMMAY
jgi:hypothetical protein